jgi:hypothetical protein
MAEDSNNGTKDLFALACPGKGFFLQRFLARNLGSTGYLTTFKIFSV